MKTRAAAAFRPKSFAELRQLAPEPDWLWRGFLAAGSLTMLSGQPFAGKSTLVSGLLRALEDGDPFLGAETRSARGLLISEEDEAPLRERARLFGLFESTSEYVPRSESVRREWPHLIRAATEYALRNEQRLLVIDTFPGLAGLAEKMENDAGAINERLRPLQQAAGEGLAVLFLHHMNAQDQPRGSRAFRGIVDISVRLLRTRAKGGIRLRTESRFALAGSGCIDGQLLQTADIWVYRRIAATSARSSGENKRGDTDTRLLQALTDAGPAGLSYAEVSEHPELSQDMAKKRFPGWLAEGKISRHGGGTKNDPWRWSIVSTGDSVRCGSPL